MGLTPRQSHAISAIWGLCEATFFFFVPDIWLSRLALTNLRAALVNLLWATAGALLGGCIIYFAGHYYFSQTSVFLDTVPAISPAMITQSGAAIETNGLLPALISGMLSGIPYKIYAAWSGHLALPLTGFLLASALARMARFLIVTIIYYGISRLLAKKLPAQAIFKVYVASWIIFYTAYFWKFGLF